MSFESESEHRMIEILRILADQEKPTGSKLIAQELKNKGFNLGERAVRYHMQILDEKGYTERMGYSGRQITELGMEKLQKGLIYDQVDFIYSKFQEMIYLTDFDYRTQKGNVVVNTSNIHDDNALETIKDVFKSGLCVSPYVNIKKIGSSDYQIKTICGTTIDGILLNEGITSIPLYGGLLEIENNTPTKFTELISYKKTSVTPLDAFVAPEMTSVLNVINEGSGLIPANFRIIPSAVRSKTIDIIDNLTKNGIGGAVAIGEEGKNVLGIPVSEGMFGMAILGGITPFCAAQELNYNIDIKIAEEITDFDTLRLIETRKPNYKLRCVDDSTSYEQIPYFLSKAWNSIEMVDFDIEKKKGNIISNVSYIPYSRLDDCLAIMEETYSQNTEYINPFYRIIDHPTNDDEIGIATICSLTIDGILIKNGIMSNPQYGGLLETGKNPMFIDLISYTGSSIDPHKIFISKNMTSISGDNPAKILASLKEIPYVSRDYAVYLLDIIKGIGFSIYKIGKPRELIYNAKVDNYNFGIVTGSGLNMVAALKESGIDVKVKAMEKLISFESMDRF